MIIKLSKNAYRPTASLFIGLWITLAFASVGYAEPLRMATPWTDKADTVATATLRNFAPWAFSEKAMNGGAGPNSAPFLFKWEGPIEVAFVGLPAPRERAEIRRWLKKLGPYYPGQISISPTVTPNTDIVFALKSEKNGADLRGTLQQALSAKYRTDIPLFPRWETRSWCQTLWFSRDIVKVRPLPVLSFMWRNIERNDHPIDFVFVAIQANFDEMDPARFTQRTRNLLRTACIAEETLHALTGWQDIPDEGRGSTTLNADTISHPKARGLEAEAIMEQAVNEPTRADLLGMRILYDRRLRAGMTEDETRPVVIEILSQMKGGR